MKKLLLSNLFALLACLLCSMSATAQEAYACFTSADSTMTFYFDDLRSTREGATYDAYNNGSIPRWQFSGVHNVVTQVVFDPSFADARPTTTNQWFEHCKLLRSITGLEYLNTSQTTKMNRMFYECGKLTSLDLSHFNTENVTTMYGMFSGCSSLTSLDVSHFDTSNVTSMASLFSGCSSLTSLDVDNFDTSNVTDMGYMFSSCKGLTSIDLSHLNTSNVTKMNSLFSGC